MQGGAVFVNAINNMPTGIYDHYKIRGKNPKNLHFIQTNKKIRKKVYSLISGNKNYAWKGENVGYRGMHQWVVRNKGKATKCSFCGKIGKARKIHWMNIDHKYKRILNDYIQACTKCHGKYDKKLGLRKHNKIK